MECDGLANRPDGRSLFVLIENFDDFCEEVEDSRDTAEALNELARLANRYGPDGLHLVAAGALDTPHALKKRVLAGGYGVGLRDADSLTTLRAYTRSFTDLPPGCGYIVTGGQLMKLQVALPYRDSSSKLTDLDQWVADIIDKQADEGVAEWSQPWPEGVDDASDPRISGTDGVTGAMALTLLRQAVSHRSQSDGLSLADLGIDLNVMADDDLLRMAETYFAPS
jgi:hypothetical protein